MAMYLSVLQNTAKRIFRRRSFWIIQGIFSILPLLVGLLIYLSAPWGRLAGGTGPTGFATLVLYVLVLPILAGPVILEDGGSMGEILWSGPVDSLVHFAGVFSGLWLALFTGILIQLGSWFLVDLLWVNMLAEWAWLVSLSIQMLAVTLVLSLTFLLAVIVRRTLPLLLLWAAVWVWVYLVVVFSGMISEGFNPLHTNAFLNVLFYNLSLSPSLGLGLSRDQFLGMFAWFTGVSLFAASLALFLSSRLDKRRSERRPWFSPVLVVAALLAAAGGYQMNANAVTAHAIPPSPYSIQADFWEVLSQHTELDVNVATGQIKGEARLVLSPSASLAAPELVLRLNPALAVTAARDGNGVDLNLQRVGDSLVISLGYRPQSPVTLDIAWQGRLQIPYTAYEQQWKFITAPGLWRFTHMPSALQAYVQPRAGYLLRDGDWMPWPWTTSIHQAREGRLVIRPTGSEAAASAPVENGAAVWEGHLPEGLLVFLPSRQIKSGSSTIAASPLLGELQLSQAALFAGAAEKLARQMDIPAPSYVVVVPYLSKLVWSGDLLLVPDGSGYYLSEPLNWLYIHPVSGQHQAVLNRATLASLARTYLLDRTSPPKLELAPMGMTDGKTHQVIASDSLLIDTWQENRGHWVKEVEVLDVTTTWDPRRSIRLSNQGKWSVVAFWLAMELADEQTRQEDLELIAYFAGEGRPERHFSRDDFNLSWERVWPSVLEIENGRLLVWQLHGWAETLGTKEALSLFAEVIHEQQPDTVESLIALLEERSGIRMTEVIP